MSLINNWNKFVEHQAEEQMNSRGQMGLLQDAIGFCKQLEIDSVLCVGCGDGTECEMFSEFTKSVTGITLNLEGVKYNTSKGGSIGTKKMDMHDMKFDDESFDLVFSKDCFEHAISHVIAFSEMLRVSKKYVFIDLPEYEKEGEWHYMTPTPFQMRSLARRFGVNMREHINDKHASGFGNHYYYLIEK
jgi:SAM-dependent methyltransferase